MLSQKTLDGFKLKKPKPLQAGDTVAIVSLSSGILGDVKGRHYIEIGCKRLESFGLKTVFMPNCLRGTDYIEKHPEERANDLKMAFGDDRISGIICAIGGNDTFLTLPYLLDDEEFRKSVIEKPKVFTGYSDTTINHLMFYKLGLQTYYGFSFINDFSEMGCAMLPYTKTYFLQLFENELNYTIRPSKYWYEERDDFTSNAIGTERNKHKEKRGFDLISGSCRFKGRLLGGCLDSLYDALTGAITPGMEKVINNYNIIPETIEWKDKIVFLESSQGNVSKELFSKQIKCLKKTGMFKDCSGMLFGKMQNDKDNSIVRDILMEELLELSIPIMININFGHAYPRCMLPYGAFAEVDATLNSIKINA